VAVDLDWAGLAAVVEQTGPVVGGVAVAGLDLVARGMEMAVAMYQRPLLFRARFLIRCMRAHLTKVGKSSNAHRIFLVGT